MRVICIKAYKSAAVGSVWVSRPDHYMFQNESGEWLFLTPHILKEYFKEIK